MQERKCVVQVTGGQKPAANTFALDLNEGLTVELDLVGIGFRHQMYLPNALRCSTTDFESAVLVVCQSIERWNLGFQRTDQDVPYRQEFVSCFNAKQ
jgi:hypothetical protein